MDIKFQLFAQLNKADALIANARQIIGPLRAQAAAAPELIHAVELLADAMALLSAQSQERMFALAQRDDQLAQQIQAIGRN